jgi:hypothetical protein
MLLHQRFQVIMDDAVLLNIENQLSSFLHCPKQQKSDLIRCSQRQRALQEVYLIIGFRVWPRCSSDLMLGHLKVHRHPQAITLVAQHSRPSNALRAVGCIPSMECTKVKENLDSACVCLSQMTRNGSMRRSACLEAIRQLSLRKLGSQGVKSTSSTREARPLTPHLARSNFT